MILTKPDILTAIFDGDVVIQPKPKLEHIGPNSVDLHLANELLVYSNHGCGPDLFNPLDVRKSNPTETIVIGDEGVILEPGTLYLGSTMELTDTPNHIPYLGGRSSVGRLGIFVHCTAGFGDVGFRGRWTLEIMAVHHVRIYAGMRIAQLWLLQGSSRMLASDKYQGRYQGDMGPVASKMHLPTCSAADPCFTENCPRCASFPSGSGG